MYTKLERTKVFRDPLYGYITVDYKIISDLIDTKELQRLRRIHQLSGVGMVFQTAEHSRFTHSLGAYHMANLVINNVAGMEDVPIYDKIVFLCAALLHDVGHGPFSHAFELISQKHHEEYTVMLIENPKTEINKILSIQKGLAEDIASVIKHDGKFPLIESLVSSQLDVDRMDYLSRDAYMTGAAYGNIDYYRILRSMRVRGNTILCKASGVHSIESYLMSRYHMYFQVYYHPTARSFEVLLESIYKRILFLHNKGYRFEAKIGTFIKVLNNPEDLKSYVDLDDYYITGVIKQLAYSKDKILSKLCDGFLNRKLFKVIDVQNEPDMVEIDNIKAKYTSEELLFYFNHAIQKGQAYTHSKTTDIDDIKVLLPDGSIKSLDRYSPIIKSLVSSSYTKIERYYYYDI